MKKLLAAYLLLLCAAICAAQEQTAAVGRTDVRPRVAVVLSGGGAKGMAHIGALRVIERAGIPIDYIVGTSMGAIVGGLYSIGYDAAGLDSLVRGQDWPFLLSDRANLRNQSLDERKKQNTYILSKPLTLHRKDNEQRGGLVHGQNLASLFARLTVGYHDSIDFTTLPIPFACVATNIVDNSEYDFHSGVLSTAMRASMAIPGAFTPVRIDSMVLVDGGMRNNFPVDVARRMGADMVIGVSVQSEIKSADQLRTGMDILGQVVDVNTKNKFEENMAMTDVPIRVNVEGYSSASFTRTAIDTLIRRGEEAAMQQWDRLMELKKTLGMEQRDVPRRMMKAETSGLPGKIRLAAIDFQDIAPADRNFLIKRYRLHEGDSISSQQIEQAVTALRGDLFYTDAQYSLRQMPGGYWLMLSAKGRKVSQLNLGVRFDTEEMVALQVNASYMSHTKLPVNLQFTGRLGKRMMARVDAEFNPLNFNKFALSYIFRHNDINVYDRGRRDYNTTFNTHSVDLSVLNISGRNYIFDFATRYDYYHYRDVLIGQGVERPKGFDNEHFISYHFRMHYNSEDRWMFTTRGARFEADYGFYTDDFVNYKNKDGLHIASANWRVSFPLNSRLVIQPMVYGRILLGDDTPMSLANVMGGEWFGHYLEQQVPFAGTGGIEYMENALVACRVQAQQRIADNNYVFLRVAAAQHADKLRKLLKNGPTMGFEAAYYYDSLFGPLGATIGYSDLTRGVNFYINLGFRF